MSQKIVIGTAQFGLKYGVANTGGQVSDSDAIKILSLAKEHGIDTLDTAVAYGDSEQVLGRIGVDDWLLMSKLPPLPEGLLDVRTWVNQQVNHSLQALKIKKLHVLFLHRPEQLLGGYGKELYRSLLELKHLGSVEKIGISVYDTAALDLILRNMHFDVVQAPYNILDTRLVTSGWMRQLEDIGCELHVRSIFLQGLLLMNAADRPKYFDRWKPLWDTWDAWLRETGVPAIELCLAHALSTSGVAKIVLGVQTPAQMLEILAHTSGVATVIPSDFKCIDTDLLNPSNWKIS